MTCRESQFRTGHRASVGDLSGDVQQVLGIGVNRVGNHARNGLPTHEGHMGSRVSGVAISSWGLGPCSARGLQPSRLLRSLPSITDPTSRSKEPPFVGRPNAPDTYRRLAVVVYVLVGFAPRSSCLPCRPPPVT